MNKYSTELPTAILNDKGLAVTSGWLTVYCIDPEQREYQRATLEYLLEGVGLPALSFADKPVLPDVGLALIRNQDGSAWETRPDYRGETAYHLQTGQPEAVINIGVLAKELTLLAPKTSYDKWNGKKWVTDTAMQHQAAVNDAQETFNQYLREATVQISPLEDAVNMDIATVEEKNTLQAWKAYRVQLTRLTLDNAPEIDWPTLPTS